MKHLLQSPLRRRAVRSIDRFKLISSKFGSRRCSPSRLPRRHSPPPAGVAEGVVAVAGGEARATGDLDQAAIGVATGAHHVGGTVDGGCDPHRAAKRVVALNAPYEPPIFTDS